MNTEILTIYRFLAAYIVVIFHFGKATGLASLTKGFLVAGPQMVTFFFVLSGFVMSYAYFQRQEFSVKSFYWARFCRIVPIYIVALVLSAYLFRYTIEPKALALNLFFLQTWIPQYSLTINPPGWSLSVEFGFYLLFPLFLLLNKLKTRFLVALTLIIYVATQTTLIKLLNSSLYVEGNLTHDFIYYFPLSHMCSFLFGIMTFKLADNIIHHDIEISKKYKTLFWSISYIIAVILVFYIIDNGTFGRVFNFYTPLGGSFLAPIFATLIFFSVNRDNLFSNTKHLKLLVLLGESSYVLYILHYPLFIMYRNLFTNNIHSPSYIFYSFSVLLILLSVLIHLYFEKPIQLFLKNKLNKNN